MELSSNRDFIKHATAPIVAWPTVGLLLSCLATRFATVHLLQSQLISEVLALLCCTATTYAAFTW